MPRAKEIAEKYAKNDKVAVIGVSSYGDTADAIKSYLKDNGLEYPVVCDADKSLGKTLGAKQVNSAYVISGGKLFWRGGMHKAGRDSVVEAVDAALGGKEAPASDKPFNG